MKKILAMALSVAIIAALAIGGTVAYFTDSDAATNVFTVGNVKIKLLEQQRDGNNLIDFVQEKNLMPIVAQNAELDGFGMSTAQNYQDKIVRVENTGKSEAWVRIFVAVPAALDDRNAAGAVTEKTALHWDTGENFVENSTDTNTFSAEFDDAVRVSKRTFAKVEYNIYCFTRKTPLQPEQTTAAAFVGFYLDKNVDYDGGDGYYYIGSKEDKDNRITVKGVGAKDDESGDYYAPFDVSEGVLIPVCAEAVQAAGFDTPDAAFKSAIEGNISSYDPWSAGNAVIKLPGAAQTAAELKTDLNGLKSAKGEQTITLNPNMVYDMSGNTDQINCIQEDAEIIIEGNGAVITGLTKPLIRGVNAKSITIRDLTISGIDITVDDKYAGAFIQFTAVNLAHDVTLSNCHLKNSKITGTSTQTSEARVGGLIGWVNLPADGSITIENCSVEKCELVGKGMVGGLAGDLQNGKMTVTNSAVKDCTINSSSTSWWSVGTVVGRHYSGNATVTGFTGSGNKLTQDGAYDKVSPDDQAKNHRNIYGRKSSSGSLTVEGTKVY